MKKTIFIVEDDLDISELMQTVVESEGYEVQVFPDHTEILASAVEVRPALILMDLWISGEDGGDLVRTLKRRGETSSIPIVLVSANNSLEKIARQCGADGFLTKPFNIRDLLRMIKKFA